MFKQISIFRFGDDWLVPEAHAIEEALALSRHVPIEPTQRESVGWTDPRGVENSPLIEVIDGQFILKLMTELRKVPAPAVREKLEERVEKMKKETGLQRVGSKMKKELKEQIELELLPHCIPSKSATTVWIDPKTKFIVIGAGSTRKTDTIITLLVKLFSELGDAPFIKQIQTKISCGVAMADWLVTQEPPADFTVDRECVLKSSEDSKSVVRYGNHALDIKEVVEHIQLHGKMPKSLAVTFNNRISFILGDDMSIKKIDILDIAFESAKAGDSGFDADVAIATAEIKELIKALIEVLGGEHDFTAPTVATVAVEVGHVAVADGASTNPNPFEDEAVDAVAPASAPADEAVEATV